jgi:hypothetical protein
MKALAEARQHDNVSFQFKGETLNALITAARQSRSPIEINTPPPLPPPDPAHVQPHDIENYINQLALDKYAGHDLIPIHEIRAIVARNHGPEAASHPAFDPIIKQMRSGGLLKIIAISDNRDATSQQLNDSIPGMNETLFYVVRN